MRHEKKRLQGYVDQLDLSVANGSLILAVVSSKQLEFILPTGCDATNTKALSGSSPTRRQSYTWPSQRAPCQRLSKDSPSVGIGRVTLLMMTRGSHGKTCLDDK